MIYRGGRAVLMAIPCPARTEIVVSNVSKYHTLMDCFISRIHPWVLLHYYYISYK